MKVLNPKSWGTALGAGLIATVTMLPQAKGELVYESGTGAQAPSAVESGAQAQIEDRNMTRQTLGASEKVQVTLQQTQAPQQTQALAVAPAPLEVAAPLSVAPAMAPTATIETQNMSKAELMRRERQREEIKNEDILQERLEELRLRDERRRTDEVLGASGAGAPTGAARLSVAPPMAPTATVLREEVVTAPVTEHPGTAGVTAMTGANRVSVAPPMVGTPVAATDTVVVSQSAVSVAPVASFEGPREDRTVFSITPRAGISNMAGESGFFQISPHFSGGLAVAMGSGEYLTFQVGYTFSQYGVSMASSNPWAIQAQNQATYLGQGNFQTLNMNQNVFDAGVKIHLLGTESKFRPFVGGGGAYAMSYINFNSTILSQMNQYAGGQNLSPDYKINNFLGFLSTGADFKVAKNISVGAEFRYYVVFSDTESSTLNPYYGAFYGGYSGYGQGGVSSLNQDTTIAGGSLARNNFYSIMGNVTFSF